ncbi:outer membrane lipase/esterase [Massilia sp. UYP11]|uniref:SGNH/GDSL hydrolase family protein n=1 Tax=Massilia sp. UYP11 TaxID=1756385 RepID=UPI003D1BD669
MRHTKFALAVLTAALLTACGGGTSPAGGDQTAKLTFTNLVSFGDSLSDVGTYRVGAVAAAGGGKFTINGDSSARNVDLNGKIWLDFMAAQLKLPAPCAAQTGLQGNASLGFNVPIVNHPNCFNYAQGGSRVVNPVGPGNAATGSPIGEMTTPMVTQIANHLGKTGNKFSGTELVTVLSGGNDVLMQLAAVTSAGTAAGAQAFATALATRLAAGATNPQAAAQAIGVAIATENARPGKTDQSVVTAAVTAAAMQPGNQAVAQPAVYGPIVAAAQADGTAAGNAAAGAYATANAQTMVTALGTAGAQMAGLVRNELLAKGAKYVIVANLPDVASTPTARSRPVAIQQLVTAMVNAFNTQLKAGLGADDARVLYTDLYTVSNDQVKNPGPYGLTNTSAPACADNALGMTSLICTANNTVAGDVSRYMFADGINPTPFENDLIARYVFKDMAIKGWL